MKMEKIRIVLLSFVVVCLTTCASFAEAKTMRGIGLEVKDSKGKQITSFSGSYALVIGVSNYRNGWPKLPGVLEDIKKVREVLQEKGFLIMTVIDPDSRQLEDAFDDFRSKYGAKADHRLVFYFAGHGHTVTPQWGGETPGVYCSF